MNIGYLVETPITEEKRLFGAQISFLSLLEELTERGVTPFVVVSEEWELTDRLKCLGISYIVTPIWEFFTSLDGAYGEVHDAGLQEAHNALSEKRVLDYFGRNEVQLVHMNTRFCGLIGARVASKLTVPYIFHIREFLAEDFGLAFKNQELADETIGGSASLIAVSKSIADHLREAYPGTPIDIIYNGVDQARYSCEPRPRMVQGTIHIAMTGRIIEHKGQMDAVRAVEILSRTGKHDVKLLLIGHRPQEMTAYENSLMHYVLERGLTELVEFVPFTDKVAVLLENCDIGLTCSKKEAFGRVTVEYMLANLLAVGADSGGTSEIIQSGTTGLVYEQGNHQELARLLEWAIANRDDSNRMIMAGRERATADFSVAANAEGVLRVYRRILAGGGEMAELRNPPKCDAPLGKQSG